MKITKNIALIIAGALIVVGLILCGISFAMTGGDFMVYNTNENYVERNCDFDASEVKEIVLDEYSRNVHLISSSDEKIHITVYENEKVNYEIDVTDDDILNVSYHSNMKWYDYIGINIDITHVDTTIAVPYGYKGNIRFEISSGKVDATGINIDGKMSGSAKSGNVNLSDITLTGSLKIDTNSGSIEMNDCLVGGDISTECTSGDVELKNITGINYTLKANSGSIRGRLLTSRNNGFLTANATSGKIEISNSSFDGDINIECNSGDIELDTVSGENITLNATSGEITAIIYGSEKDYRIDTDSSSGNINSPRSSSGKKTLSATTHSGYIYIAFK